MRGRAAVRLVGVQHWIIYPALLTLLAAFVFATPVRVFSLPLPEPVFPMIVAFAWPLIRPSLVAPIALLLCGLFLDLLWYAPTGLWGVVLVTVYGVLLAARPFIIGQDIRVLFAWYAGLSLGALLLAYGFVLNDADSTPTFVGMLLQWAATLPLFLFAYRLIERFDDNDVRFR